MPRGTTSSSRAPSSATACRSGRGARRHPPSTSGRFACLSERASGVLDPSPTGAGAHRARPPRASGGARAWLCAGKRSPELGTSARSVGATYATGSRFTTSSRSSTAGATTCPTCASCAVPTTRRRRSMVAHAPAEGRVPGLVWERVEHSHPGVPKGHTATADRGARPPTHYRSRANRPDEPLVGSPVARVLRRRNSNR